MFLIIFTLVAIWLFYELYWKRRNFPPGPMPLPLIGTMHYVFWNQPGYKFAMDCKREYKNIYTIWMGGSPGVVICDYDLMKETFVKDGDAYTDKFAFKGLNEIFRGGNYGIIEATGDLWRDHRRFALHQMRDLGLGKMKMEERILIEMDELANKLIEEGTIADIQTETQMAVSNIINQMIFGYRFSGEKRKEMDKLMELLDKQQSTGTWAMIVILFGPEWTKELPILRGYWKKFLVFRDEFFGFFERQIQQHKNEVDYEAEDSTDYVEAYLKEKKVREELGDFETFSDIQLKNVVLDLWTAGLQTTVSTLNWGIAYILNNPHVQEKIHEEMDRVIGSSRHVMMNDKPNLPYTHAEMQRVMNVVVTNLPHVTTKDVTVAGYFLPKGTTVVADIGTLLYDENLFPNPMKFDPERFLENGKVKNYPEVMPFSIGKRSCPGEGLARMELFIFVANIFNKFKLTSVNPPPLKKTFMTMQKPIENIEVTAEYRF